MLHVSKVSRDHAAIPAYKNIWLIDESKKMIRENLGSGRPAFFYGDVYPTLESAKAAGYANFGVIRLQDEIKLPTKSPIINRLNQHQESNSPITRISVLTFDLEGSGLSLDDYPIANVDFTIPGPHLIDILDFVPHRVYLQAHGYTMRISIAYDREGNVWIKDNPAILNGETYEKSPKHVAFLQQADAIREAERIEKLLLRAADWRSRNNLFQTAREEQAAA